MRGKSKMHKMATLLIRGREKEDGKRGRKAKEVGTLDVKKDGR